MQRNAAGNFTAVFNKKKSWKGVLKKSACPWENPWSEPNASKSATFFDFAQKKVPEETSWFRITDRGIRTYGGLLDSRFATGVGWLTQWSSQVEEMSAGPNTRAGFIPAPVKGTWGKISIQYQCQEWISNNWNACLEIVYRNIVVTVFRPRGWKRSGFFWSSCRSCRSFLCHYHFCHHHLLGTQPQPHITPKNAAAWMTLWPWRW